MRICVGAIVALFMVTAQALAATDPLRLPLPANRTYSVERQGGSYSLAVGPWKDGRVEMLQATGNVSIESWRLPSRGGQTGALMADLARQAKDAGFEILFQCAQDVCGGFDFRFSLEVAPEPMMHVDLGDYQYLAARRPGPGGTEYLSLVVSSSPEAGFLQIVRVLPHGTMPAATERAAALPAVTDPPNLADRISAAPPARPEAAPGATAPPPAIVPVAPAPTTAADAPIAEQLEQNGHVVLSDLTFQPGSSELGAGPFASLGELARFLLDNPDRRVALVGHSDAQGALSGNITLSERRAVSVRERLIKDYGVPARQILAKGVGFLAPVASNLTEDGRARNRRVEAVLISTE